MASFDWLMSTRTRSRCILLLVAVCVSINFFDSLTFRTQPFQKSVFRWRCEPMLTEKTLLRYDVNEQDFLTSMDISLFPLLKTSENCRVISPCVAYEMTFTDFQMKKFERIWNKIGFFTFKWLCKVKYL